MYNFFKFLLCKHKTKKQTSIAFLKKKLYKKKKNLRVQAKKRVL